MYERRVSSSVVYIPYSMDGCNVTAFLYILRLALGCITFTQMDYQEKEVAYMHKSVV